MVKSRKSMKRGGGDPKYLVCQNEFGAEAAFEYFKNYKCERNTNEYNIFKGYADDISTTPITLLTDPKYSKELPFECEMGTTPKKACRDDNENVVEPINGECPDGTTKFQTCGLPSYQYHTTNATNKMAAGKKKSRKAKKTRKTRKSKKAKKTAKK